MQRVLGEQCESSTRAKRFSRDFDMEKEEELEKIKQERDQVCVELSAYFLPVFAFASLLASEPSCCSEKRGFVAEPILELDAENQNFPAQYLWSLGQGTGSRRKRN